jgi:hypothetical protein
MILTEEQLRELQGPELARAVDPRTNATYVLLPADLYERLHPQLTGPTSSDRVPPMPPAAQRSRAAFLRDLPRLLADNQKHRRWVAYHEGECIAWGPSQRGLIRECVQRGLREEDCYIGMVVPHAAEPETVDPSLFEIGEPPGT